MKTTLFAGLVSLLALASPSFAQMYELGDLMVDHVTSFETPKTARAAAGYMTITNSGSQDDRLVEVRADFPRVMIHNTKEDDGVMKMVHVHDGVAVPAGGSVKLAPGGLHVMFMGLNKVPFVAGDMVRAELVFEKAGVVEVMFKVVKRGEALMDHSGHSQSD